MFPPHTRASSRRCLPVPGTLSLMTVSSGAGSLRAMVLGAVLLATSGCGAVKRVHECEGIIDTVNGGLANLHVEVPDAGASPSAYARIADAYDTLGKSLDELAPTDPSLVKALASYREVTDRAAKQSRSYSEALAGGARSRKEKNEKQARLSRIRAQAKNDLVREATAVRKLNAVCHP
jgi:hypothetical protein